MDAENRIKILVVNDNDASRYAVCRLMQRAGYDVLEAANGQKGFSLAAEHPDLLILDVKLPDVSGLEICYQLKTDPATAHIPILMLSATYIDDSSYVLGLEHGADAYLVEPVEPTVLIATAQALLRTGRAEAALRRARDELELRVAGRTAELAESNKALQAEIAQRKQAEEAAQRQAIVNARLYEEVKAGRAELQRLSHQIIQAEEEERRRLSRELHDSAGQIATALQINLSLMQQELPPDNSSLQMSLELAMELALKLYDEIRAVSYALRPLELETLGLNRALESLCREFSTVTRQSISYKGSETPSVSDTLLVTLYRFVQEALNNAVKHAQASQITVSLNCNYDTLTVTVEDNGIGFTYIPEDSLNVATSGIGLATMRERLNMLGGSLSIKSAPGQGMRLTAHCQITAA